MIKTTKNLIKLYKKEAKEILKKRKEKFKAMKYRVKNSRQKVKKRVERKFRLWYRLSRADKNGNVKCYTCNRVHNYKEVDAGHYIHRHLNLDERNHKCQCIFCNKYLSGNLSKYREHLLADYGEEWIKQLEQDAKNEKRLEVKEMLEIEKELNQKIKILKEKLKKKLL